MIPRVDIEASGALVANLSFDRCEFLGVQVGAWERPPPEDRIVLRDIHLRGCAGPVRATGAILDGIVIDGWKGGSRSAPILHDCFFRHVRLTGAFGGLDISSRTGPVRADDELALAYEDDNAARYRDVDWALDVSEATLSNCKVRGVPPELIRCDGVTQAIVLREAIPGLHDAFDDVELVGTVGSQIRYMRNTGSLPPDPLIWIEARSKHRGAELDLIARLYALGLAMAQPAAGSMPPGPAGEPLVEPAPSRGDPTTLFDVLVVHPPPARAAATAPPGRDAPGRRLTVGSGRTLEDQRFSGERIERLFVAGELGGDTSTRAGLRWVTFERCNVDKGLFAKALIEDVRFEDVGPTYPTTISGWIIQECALRHVVLAGLVDHLDIHPIGPTSESMPTDILTWALDKDRIHAEADWVLDVREAELSACRIQGLPADKVRYDPARQAVITPQSMGGVAEAFTIGSSDLVGWIGHVIRQVLRGRIEQIAFEPLLWVDPRSIHRSAELQLIERLHDHGLTLPSI